MDNYLKSSNIAEEKIHIGQIPAILFRPRGNKGLFPTIILYHGWGSNKESQRIRGFILSAIGYQVIIPDAINHGERNPIDHQNIGDPGKYFWDTILKNLDEVENIINELILQYDADQDRIGVIGNSMGGFTAAGVFTHNPKIRASVVFNGSYGWENSNKIFKESFEITITEDLTGIEDKINKLDPMNNLELLKNRPILILHGDSDSVVSIESQRIFYQRIEPLYENKQKIKFVEYPNLNHFVTTNMMEESISWFHRYL